MAQTKLLSFIESVTNTVVGFCINFTANLLILPLFGFDVKPSQAFLMGLIFTLISVVRGYIIRRLFNRKES